MDITAVSFVTLDGLKEFLKKCKETFALKTEIPEEYKLPIASKDTLGGVKIGENLNITADGVLNATGGGSSGSVDSLLFQKEYHSDITKISNFPALPGSVDLYFPNVTDITSDALMAMQWSSAGYPTLHFSIANRATIKALDGYPKFGSNYSENVSYLFDIGAIKMTINKGSANVVYVGGESASDVMYIAPSTDISIIACDGVGLLLDTVNKVEDFTYDVSIPATGTAVGLNFIDAADDATVTVAYTYNGIKIATLSGKATSISCSAETELSTDATIISGGTPYLYGSVIKSFVDVSLADCTKATNYLVYTDGTVVTKTEKEVETIGKYQYAKYENIQAVRFEACTSIGEGAFQECSRLTTISLPAATSIGSYAFQGCSQLTTISLPAATSIGSYAFQGCSRLTEIHFAAANQATIEALSDYASKFGATNATIYFDL